MAPHQPPPHRLSLAKCLFQSSDERAQTQLFIGTLGARTRDRNLFPLIVSNTAFGGTFSGPLMQEVRAVRGWSYSAYSRLLHAKQREAWYMATAPASEYSADCAALQLDLLERWVDQSILTWRMLRARAALVDFFAWEEGIAHRAVAGPLRLPGRIAS